MITLGALINKKMFKQIGHSAEPKIIGVTNGVTQLNIDINSLDGISHILIDSTIKDFLLNQHLIPRMNLPEIKGTLLNKAKLTDIMVFSPYMFGIKYVVSEKFVNCLSELNVSDKEYHLFPISIKDVVEKYYLFFVPYISNREVNFSKSLLYPDNEICDDQKSYFKINSYQEYCELNERNPMISFEKLTLPSKYKERDIISLQGVVNIYFSQELFESMRANNISSLVIPNRQIILKFDN